MKQFRQLRVGGVEVLSIIYMNPLVWTVWTIWGAVLLLFVVKLYWTALDKLTTYGKLQPDSSKILSINYKTFFSSIYAFGWIWNLSLLLITFSIINASSESPEALIWIRNVIEKMMGYPIQLQQEDLQRELLPFSILYQLQFTRRFLECRFVHRFSNKNVLVFNTLLAFGFYVFACSSPIIELISHTSFDKTPLLQKPTFILAILLFLFGSYNQFKHHKILANLRNTTDTNKQKKNYFIPRGGWFEVISCPHYFAEIIIYFSFVVFFGLKNVSMWLIFVFVIANLTHTATQTHDWYMKIFDDYPKNRRIIIPFIY